MVCKICIYLPARHLFLTEQNILLIIQMPNYKPNSKNTMAKQAPTHSKPTGKASDRTKIVPLGDRVLVKPGAGETKTASGIIIPETIDREKPEQGRVVAVGEGSYENGKLRPVSVKTGDTVVFSKYGYDTIKVDGDEYYIIREENLLAVIK